MDNKQRQQFVENTFDTVAEGYDHPALSWFDKTAQAIVDIADIKEDQSLLDIACGTGKVTTAIASHLHQPDVTAIDLSSGMLEQAKLKASRQQLDNIQFHKMAFDEMSFNERFDLAVCSFGIFFVNEMDEALIQFARQVKQGGKIVLTTFAEGSFSPFNDAFMRLYGEYGFDIPTPGWLRLCSDKHMHQLFEDAGLSAPKCQHFDFGYEITEPQQWWNIVWNAGYRGMVDSIEEDRREAFKQQHLEEVKQLISENNNYLNVDVIISVGDKQ